MDVWFSLVFVSIPRARKELGEVCCASWPDLSHWSILDLRCL